MPTQLAYKIADTLYGPLLNGQLPTGEDKRGRLAAIINAAGLLSNLTQVAANFRELAVMYGNDVQEKLSELESEHAQLIAGEEVDADELEHLDRRLEHWRGVLRRIEELTEGTEVLT